MADASQREPEAKGFQLSTDWWAVIAALALALMVKAGAITRVPW